MTRRVDTLEQRVDSVLRLENAEVQRARQRTSCSQIRCQVGADLIVEDDSSTLVTVQQLSIAAGNDKV